MDKMVLMVLKDKPVLQARKVHKENKAHRVLLVKME
tara:strand:- start:260 stop:367 length:108 start_codon:yes stop_codon:yes gene_type:complete